MEIQTGCMIPRLGAVRWYVWEEGLRGKPPRQVIATSARQRDATVTVVSPEEAAGMVVG